MAYRPALHPPSGKWGVFLDQLRRERGWSAVAAWELMAGPLGLSKKSVATYKAMEQGQRTITATEEAALIRLFGKGPADEPEPALAPIAPPDDLAGAIRALTAELQVAREEREALRVERASVLARLDRLDAILEVLAPPAMRADGAPVARREIAGSA